METVLITGGTGLIGTALTSLLRSHNYNVILLTRGPAKKSAEGIKYAAWDPQKGSIDAQAIGIADHIIHLAGANVSEKRWTAKRKKEIVDSRVKSGHLLVKALAEIPNRVRTVVSSSAIGWYGPDPEKPARPFLESDSAAADFLGQTCEQWEDSVAPVASMGIRLVYLRTGIVLSNEGGAFPELVRSLPFGVAAILGNGRQMISWIHIDDIARLYLEAIRNENMHGPYNSAAPEVISNKEFVLRAARLRRRPFLPVHVPEFVLKIALGEMSVEVLKSATVSDVKVREAGFKFIYPSVDSALNQLLAR